MTFRAGQSVEDLCRVCKEPRDHRVIAVDERGDILRVICGTCGSQHNFRGGAPRAPTSDAGGARVLLRGATANAPRPAAASVVAERAHDRAARHPTDLVGERERAFPKVELAGLEGLEGVDEMDLEMMLRRVIREESGLSPAAPADKWRGGELVLKPGKPGVQEKSLPIDTFFHKIVMLRNRLRTLEQKVNASKLAEDEKVELQAYVTGCYGSLTTFNVLFADEADKFKGSSDKE